MADDPRHKIVTPVPRDRAEAAVRAAVAKAIEETRAVYAPLVAAARDLAYPLASMGAFDGDRAPGGRVARLLDALHDLGELPVGVYSDAKLRDALAADRCPTCAHGRTASHGGHGCTVAGCGCRTSRWERR